MSKQKQEKKCWGSFSDSLGKLFDWFFGVFRFLGWLFGGLGRLFCCLGGLFNAKGAGTAANTDAGEAMDAEKAAKAKTGKNIRNSELDALIDEIKSPRTKKYVTHRLKPQMDWYSKKSRENKELYIYWTSITIILSALIPLLSVSAIREQNVLQYLPVWTAILGSMVTTINAFLALHNYKELWLTYRSVRESLLRTLYFYLTDTEMFKNKSQPQQDALLVEICEMEMARENGAWLSLKETATINSQPQPDNPTGQSSGNAPPSNEKQSL